MIDRDGLVSHWSRGARRLFSTTREEAIGRTAVDLSPSPAPTALPARALLAEETSPWRSRPTTDSART
ncbi:PAS domain-containing protein [Streptomyces sp. L7]